MLEFFNWMVCGPNESWAALLIRIAFGISLFPFGYQKIKNFSNKDHFPTVFGMPPALAYSCAAMLEFFGSIFLVAGFLTRLAALAMVVQFIVAAKVSMGKDGTTPAYLFLSVSVVILILGAGPYSIDGWIASFLSSN